MPQVSVIICHHKGNLIDGALKSFEACRGVTFEIIVATSVDGASFPGTRTVYIPGGPAHKRNVAARFASGEYLAFYDDDVEVDADSLFHLQSYLAKHDKCGMVFGKLLNMEWHDRFDEAGSYLTHSGFLWARAESGVLDRGQFERAEPVLAGKSAACMIRRKQFFEVGMFDASYEILAEETDLAWRVWIYGYSVWYVPSSITFHAFNTKFKPRDFYTPSRVYFNGCRNYISMILTNLQDPCRLMLALTVQYAVWFFAGMGFFVTGKFEAGKHVFMGLFFVIKHLPRLLEKRRKVQAARKISDRELLPIITRNPGWRYYIHRFLRYIKVGLHG